MPARSSLSPASAFGSSVRFDRTEIVIDAAAKRFRDQGYPATSLQQIAKDVGITKGSLYHYITTKEDLLFAVIRRNHERIIDGNRDWFSLRDDPLAALESFIKVHMRLFLEDFIYSEVYVRDFRSLAAEHAEKILEAQSRYDAQFRGLVQAAIDRGLLRSDVTPAYASGAVFGIANWVHFWVNPDGPDPIEDVADKLSKYAIASLL